MPPDPSPEMQAVQSLVGALGQGFFANAFLSECTRLSGADQIAVFGIRGGSVECLSAYRRAGQHQAFALCRRYLRQFIDRDAFLDTSLRGGSPFATAVVSCADISDLAYRRTLFQDVGLEGKIAALSCGTDAHFYLNLYYGDLGSEAFHRGLASMRRIGPLLLELLRKHRLLIASPWSAADGRAFVERYLRDRFRCLSTREVQVCARILCGQGSATIATGLGVSLPTVKTFRMRAYAKLSISSQNELFARCAGLLVP
ncbi:MAG: helix-turn-helix transcriptional regulator [Steroidobacteraceae bacterium]